MSDAGDLLDRATSRWRERMEGDAALAAAQVAAADAAVESTDETARSEESIAEGERSA